MSTDAFLSSTQSSSCHFSPQTTWDESDTRRRLSDRVWDVSRWKEALETCAQKVDEEMEALTLVIVQKPQKQQRACFISCS